MSRSGYSDDCDGTELNLYRGAVESAIRGKRGQAFLRELLADMDAMPVKELIVGRLEYDGAYCALGVVGHARGLPLHELDSDEEDDGDVLAHGSTTRSREDLSGSITDAARSRR